MSTILNTILIVITIALFIMLSYTCIHYIENLTVNDKEPNTLTTVVDENQNSLHRISSDDTIIVVRTNPIIEL